jgi:hypothetical protein
MQGIKKNVRPVSKESRLAAIHVAGKRKRYTQAISQ